MEIDEEYAPFILRSLLDENPQKAWKIIEEIEARKPIKILLAFRLQLTGDHLRLIYPDKDKLEARLWQNQGGMSLVCIAVGRNAIKNIRDLCGEHPDPWKCSRNTIRYKYRKYKPKFLDNESQYKIIYNVMHAPKDQNEAAHLLETIQIIMPQAFNR